MKKLSIIVLILIMFSMSACDILPTEGKKAETPEEFIKFMYNDLIDNKITYAEIYDNLFAGVSKKMISKEEYISSQNTDLINTNIKLTEISAKSAGDFADNTTLVNTVIKYTINNVPMTLETSEYVIVINDEYKYLYKGILGKKNYNMKTTDESNKIHSDSAVIYTTVSGITVDLSMNNNTVNNFSFGHSSGSEVKITTAGETYSTILPQVNVLNSGGKITLSAIFDGAKGTVKKIAVLNIFTLNADGTPIENDPGVAYSLNVE